MYRRHQQLARNEGGHEVTDELPEAMMIVQNPGEDEADVRFLSYLDAKGSLDGFLAQKHAWRPIAHGVRIILREDDDGNEIQYVDYVDYRALAKDLEDKRARGAYRDE